MGIPIKKYMKLAAKYFLLPLLILIVLSVISLLAYRAHLQRNTLEDTRITAPNGIESLEKVTLGGLEQWILIRGHDRSAPVLLFLHGGPGSPSLPLARRYDTELVKRFVMTHWDQRGAGKSYSSDVPPESMNLEQYISDTLELVEILRKRFDVPKIYLVGHSWGSEVGAFVVSRRPELFHAYVGIGQVVNSQENEAISYQFALDRASETQNQRALQELEAIGEPPYDDHEKLVIQRKWLARLGGLSHNKDLSFSHLIKTGMASPDYSLGDCIGFFRGEVFSTNALWNEYFQTNLFQQVPRIDVPTYFFEGRYDYTTPSEIAERYYERLETPRGKQLVWFENSAHMIPYEEPEKYSDVLINRVLKETYRPAQ